MVSTHDGVHGLKISTAVPAGITSENINHHLTNMDLVMKLHYLKGVYYFKCSNCIKELSTIVIKESLFRWLDTYYAAAGRIRLSESGRPFIRCNDSGVRFMEASCNRTLDEWLEMRELSYHHRDMVPEKVLGPDLPYSPLVLVQMTSFKCGGIAVGLSWAHVLGDAVSAANCINLWGQILAGNPPPKPHHLQNPQSGSKKPARTLPAAAKPLSVKQVKPIEGCWLNPNKCQMETFSFQITETKLKQLQSKISGENQIPPFEAISALIWQCLAKIRQDGEPKLVTICRTNSSAERGGNLSNEQIISTVMSDFSPANVELSELATMIAKQAVVDEKKEIEELVDRDSGSPDFIVYGANLTFADLEEIDFFGLELKGQKPVHVNYSMNGVGDEGAVLVLRVPERTGVDSHSNGGRMITLILPKDQISQLKKVLESEWGIP